MVNPLSPAMHVQVTSCPASSPRACLWCPRRFSVPALAGHFGFQPTDASGAFQRKRQSWYYDVYMIYEWCASAVTRSLRMAMACCACPQANAFVGEMSVWFRLVPLVVRKQIHSHKQPFPDALSPLRCFFVVLQDGTQIWICKCKQGKRAVPLLSRRAAARVELPKVM